MKKIAFLLTVAMLGFVGTSKAQFLVPYTSGVHKYRLIYGSDRVTFQDTAAAGLVKYSYQFKKAQLRAQITKYTGGTVTIYSAFTKEVVFKAPLSAFRITGVANSDSLRAKSILETL